MVDERCNSGGLLESTEPTLSLLGLGFDVPEPIDVRALVCTQAGDEGDYRGWPRVCVAGADAQPSTMAAAALAAALRESGVASEDLTLVVSVGVSRDFLPSWSLSTEVIRLSSLSVRCLGIDLTLGCLGALAGLEVARGWLALHGGAAAIVMAEKWSQTIDRGDRRVASLWAHGDGGAAVVVCAGAGRGFAQYLGGCFSSHADYNGRVLIKYGGTRNPIPPPGESPFRRQLGAQAASEVFATYIGSFRELLGQLSSRWNRPPALLVCNQVSPKIVDAARGLCGLPPERVSRTGELLGHLGSADLLLGLDSFRRAGLLEGNVAMLTSTPYAFGAGLLVAEARR
ncbi:MAG: 3-oxoacyl-[acyl-carrier-protein] synthase III C-terminal domain-containing protein [Deltaproteobacteria bacterium]